MTPAARWWRRAAPPLRGRVFAIDELQLRYRHPFVAIDRSPEGLCALEASVGLVHEGGGELTIVHAANMRPVWATATYEGEGALSYARAQLEDGEELLRRASDAVPTEILTTTRLLSDVVAKRRQLLDAVDSCAGHDLVVIGLRAHRLALESPHRIAVFLASHSLIPVALASGLPR